MVLHFHYKTELVAFYSVFCQNYRDNDPTNSRQNILEIFNSFQGGWEARDQDPVCICTECCSSSRAVATKMHNTAMYPQLSVISIENWTEIIHIICGRKSDQFRGKIWIKLPVFISRHQEDMAQRLMMGRLLYRTENCNEIDTLNRRFFFLSVTSLSLVKLSALERFLWRAWMISLIIQLIHSVFNFNP